MFTQPRLLTKNLTGLQSLCTFHVCPGASKKSSKMVSQPGRQLREQPRPSVRLLWTFHVCGTSACALMRQKVLRVRQYVRTFGPLGVFYNVLLPASLNAVQNVRFMLCQLFWFYKYDSYARYYQYTQHKVMRFTVFVNIVLKTIQAT